MSRYNEPRRVADLATRIATEVDRHASDIGDPPVEAVASQWVIEHAGRRVDVELDFSHDNTDLWLCQPVLTRGSRGWGTDWDFTEDSPYPVDTIADALDRAVNWLLRREDDRGGL